MCRIEIRTVVGVDTDGDNARDEVIVVGVAESCSGLHVGLFSGNPPPAAQPSDGIVSRAATLLSPGQAAHGVSPAANQRVFTVIFTLQDSTNYKGICGTKSAPFGLLAVCDDDDRCRDSVVWDQVIDCIGSSCPAVTVTVDVGDQCVDGTRSVSLSLLADPFTSGLAADVDFGDGSPNETVSFTSVTVAGTAIGMTSVVHTYSVPGTGATTFQVTVTIAGRVECVTRVDVPIDRCRVPDKQPPQGCPVDQLTLQLFDANGTDVTAQAEAGECLPPGRYVVRSNVVPAGVTDLFNWWVDGIAAAVGQLDVVAIADEQLTIDLATEFRSVSVVAASCASDGIDLRPCPKPCCPDLSGVTASCLPRCPPSTNSTLTATGTDIECAEVFAWEFGDGTTAETAGPTTTHTYASLGVFDAAVTIVRPERCGRPRTQRRTFTVGPCPLPCYCAFLAIASGLLLLAFLILMPLIASVTDPGTKQVLIVVMIAVVILLTVVMLWWLLDPCCRPTRCELLRIFFWVFSWALLSLGIMNFFSIWPVLPFAVAYVISQQIILRMINDGGCGTAPDTFSWPFPGCR